MAALKGLWVSKVIPTNTLSVLVRVIRLLYNLMNTVVSDQAAFQKRTQLVNSIMPSARPSPGMHLPHCHPDFHAIERYVLARLYHCMQVLPISCITKPTAHLLYTGLAS